MLENGRKKIFDKAKENITKAPAHQCKGYNNRNGAGVPFEVREKVLKCNRWEDSHKSKLRGKYTGPYLVVPCGTSGNYYLKDKYSHYLQRSVPPSQLVKFHEKKVYKMDRNAKIVLEQSSDDGCNKLDDDFEMCSEEESGITSSCRCVMSKEKASQSPTMTSAPIKSQIVIMSSTEMPLPSDESVMIDVGVEPDYCNLFGSLNVNEVYMEIVENLYEDNDETMENVTIVDSHAGAPQKFLPLTYEQR